MIALILEQRIEERERFDFSLHESPLFGHHCSTPPRRLGLSASSELILSHTSTGDTGNSAHAPPFASPDLQLFVHYALCSISQIYHHGCTGSAPAINIKFYNEPSLEQTQITSKEREEADGLVLALQGLVPLVPVLVQLVEDLQLFSRSNSAYAFQTPARF